MGQHDDRGEADFGAPPLGDQPSWAGYARPMGEVQQGPITPDDSPMHWGFLAFFSGFGGYYLLSLILAAVLAGTISDFDSPQPHRIGPLVLVSFVPNLLLGLLPLLFSWVKGRGPRLDFGIVPTGRDVRIGLACGVLSLVAGLLVNLLLLAVFRVQQQSNNPLVALRELGGARSIWLGLAALFVFLGAPLTEELLVRGALWGALAHYRVHRYAILALTALVFAFLHQDPSRTLALFCQGIAIGLARMLSGRTGASMVAHATNNLLPAAVLFFVA